MISSTITNTEISVNKSLHQMTAKPHIPLSTSIPPTSHRWLWWADKKICHRAIFLLLAICLVGRAIAAPEVKIVDGVTYYVIVAPAESVRITWKDANGVQLRTFPETARYLAGAGVGVDTLMNGGIFEPGGIPCGLLIQDGKELHPVNRNEGNGNFFLMPNGIFLIGTKGAAVIRTDEYPLKDMQIRYAVQSGPLLLRNGKTHPQFNASSTHRLHRNGVGVSKSGDVVFAMTNFNSPKFPNLFEFAQLFSKLGCEDALFLDGVISQMKSGADVYKPGNNFGSIIAVTETKKPDKALQANPH